MALKKGSCFFTFIDLAKNKTILKPIIIKKENGSFFAAVINYITLIVRGGFCFASSLFGISSFNIPSS